MVGVVSTVVDCVGRVPFVAEIMTITSQVWGDLGVMTRGYPKASEEHVIVVALYRVQGECAVFFGPPHRLFNACRSQCTLLKERIDNIR